MAGGASSFINFCFGENECPKLGLAWGGGFISIGDCCREWSLQRLTSSILICTYTDLLPYRTTYLCLVPCWSSFWVRNWLPCSKVQFWVAMSSACWVQSYDIWVCTWLLLSWFQDAYFLPSSPMSWWHVYHNLDPSEMSFMLGCHIKEKTNCVNQH